MHLRGGAEFFGKHHELLEATTYITTRFPDTVKTGDEDCPPGEDNPECRFVHLDDTKKGARDRFLASAAKDGVEIKQFELYQKFYVNDILTTLTDSIEDKVIDTVTKEIGIDGVLDDIAEITEYTSYIGDISRGDYSRIEEKLNEEYEDDIEKAKEELEKLKARAQKTLAKLQEEMKKQAEEAATQGEKQAEEGATPEGEYYPMFDDGTGDSYPFTICAIPMLVDWRINWKAGAYLRTYYSYGMVENTLKGGDQTMGATAGVGLTPQLYVDGRIAVGVGIDLEVIKIIIGLEGHVVFIKAEAPFNAQILLAPEFVNDDIVAKLYIGATLKPRMTILDAKLSILAELEIEGLPTQSYAYEIANFPPLIDRDFGNVLPIPMLDLNLVSLNQIMNAAK
ncbi:MAG TPA: hypothetical protein PLV42_05295 [bacterium]|nr:hypothetical protein [bacterium]